MVGEEQDSVWPLPKFSFAVDFAGTTIGFQEVSGLDTETRVIDYRAGNSKVFSNVKMPGMMRQGNVTLKKGVFAKDNMFWDWFNQVKMNTIKRENVTIRLLDEAGNPTMVWVLANAFPTKVSGTDLLPEGNEVAVETIELAHEGLTIENG